MSTVGETAAERVREMLAAFLHWSDYDVVPLRRAERDDIAALLAERDAAVANFQGMSGMYSRAMARIAEVKAERDALAAQVEALEAEVSQAWAAGARALGVEG